MKNKKDPQAVMVFWKDILDDEPIWKKGKVELEPPVVLTVGFIIHKDKEKIIISRDHYLEDDEQVTGGRLAILKGVIVKIVKLKPEV